MRGELVDPVLVQGTGESSDLNNLVIRTRCHATAWQQFERAEIKLSLGEFDPGSGRTLAACLTHASRGGVLRKGCITGERVRNT